MAANDNVDYRIDWLKATPVIALGAATDLTMALLTTTVVGVAPAEIEALVGDFLFPAVFALGYHVNFNRDPLKKYGLTLATDVIKTTPIVGDFVPAFTVEIATFVAMTRKEDRDDAKKNAAQSGAQQAKQQKEQARAYMAAEAREKAIAYREQVRAANDAAAEAKEAA